MKENEGTPKKKPTRKKKRVVASEKPSKKKKLATPVTMAQKYECAWKKCYYDSPKWIQSTIDDEPSGRHAMDVAKLAASLAESPNFKPKLAKYLGKVEKDIEPPTMLSGSGSFLPDCGLSNN